jgi:hypothetical protein
MMGQDNFINAVRKAAEDVSRKNGVDVAKTTPTRRTLTYIRFALGAIGVLIGYWVSTKIGTR